MIKNVLPVFVLNIRYSSQILMELELSQQIFGKILTISNSMKLHSVTAVWTDRHEGDNSHFSKFRECAQKFQLVPYREQNALASARLVGEVGYRVIPGGKAAGAWR